MKCLLLLLPLTCFADQTSVVNNYSAHSNTAQPSAISIAASQLTFDKGAYGLQWSAGMGIVEDSEAVSFGLGQRINKTLITGSVSYDGDSVGVGVGLSGKF
jgi:hypothetical protein